MPAVMEAIDRMTTSEKVEVMNYLWAAVASSGEKFVPVWHIENSLSPADLIQNKKSQYGALKGKVMMSPEFDSPLEDFSEYM